MSRTTIAWIFILASAIASLGFVLMRFSGLPEIPVMLGPELTVRTVKTELGPNSDTQPFQSGDRLVALGKQPVEELQELYPILKDLPPAPEPESPPGNKAAHPSKEGAWQQMISYQVVRPFHRFDLLLRGETIEDPTALPPGVEPSDRLVELDGRPLQGRVGPEGLRSIIASRPEALLGFERRNAVFTGQMRLYPAPTPYGVILSFLGVFLLGALLGRFRHESIEHVTAMAIALETLCFAWVTLIIFQYQWALADYQLASVMVLAFMLVRPLGLFGRTHLVDAGARSTWVALLIGLLFSVVVIVALQRGSFEHGPEQAFQLAALIAGLFIVYEIIPAPVQGGATGVLGERSIYLTGLLMFVLGSCIIAYYLEPVAFREDRWRWFAVIMLAALWFGDVLLCLRGVPTSQLEEIADVQRRGDVIADYLGELERFLSGNRLELVVLLPTRAFRMTVRVDGVVMEPCERELADAAVILLDENACIPLPTGIQSLDGIHPMEGIAESMKISLAVGLHPPAGSLDAPDLRIVLFGFREEGPNAERVEPGLEDLDDAQHRLTPVVWGALVLEIHRQLVEELVEGRTPSRVEHKSVPGASAREEAFVSQIAELEEELEAIRQTNVLLRDDRLALAEEVQTLRRWYRPAAPLPADFEELIEIELVDALRYLFEDAPEALVLAGSHGVGKTFVARCGHWIDQRDDSPCLIYESLEHDDHALGLLGEVDDGAPPMGCILDVCRGGSLIIEDAQDLDRELLGRLLDVALEMDVRLFLCFTDEEAESRSVLEGFPEALLERLEHREVIIPSLRLRRTIQEAVFHQLLFESARRHGRFLEEISPAAFKALLAYPFPGHMLEAAVVLDRAARRARSDFLELGDLAQEVRMYHEEVAPS